MANVYVYSGAAGAGTGADWANAYTTLGAATAAKAAGDVFYVAHDHAETTASALTITFPGNDTTGPNKVYCVNRAGSVPPVSADLRTTATITTTGASLLSLAGSASEINGIIFSCGSGGTTANLTCGSVSARSQRYVNCAFRLGTTVTAGRIVIGANAQQVVWENCSVQFAHTGQGLAITSGRFFWRNAAGTAAITGATLPATLFISAGAAPIFVEAVDFNSLGANALVANTVSSINSFVFKDCRLASTTTVCAAMGAGYFGHVTTLIRCDSGTASTRTELHCSQGILTTDTATVRSGGASDGVTPTSWKIVMNAIGRWEMPFVSPPIAIWNETTGSAITVTVEAASPTAGLTNADLWIDAEYLGSASTPLGSVATTTRADGLASATALTSSAAAWSGSPANKYKMSATFTPQMKGPVTVTVKLAKASTTVYVDPKPDIS